MEKEIYLTTKVHAPINIQDGHSMFRVVFILRLRLGDNLLVKLDEEIAGSNNLRANVVDQFFMYSEKNVRE